MNKEIHVGKYGRLRKEYKISECRPPTPHNTNQFLSNNFSFCRTEFVNPVAEMEIDKSQNAGMAPEQSEDLIEVGASMNGKTPLHNHTRTHRFL